MQELGDVSLAQESELGFWTEEQGKTNTALGHMAKEVRKYFAKSPLPRKE